jgi:iron(III) transport system permease protein
LKQLGKFLRKGPAFLVAGMMVVPIIFVLSFAVKVDASIWERMWQIRIPDLLKSSLLLAFAVTCGALILGTTLALLIEQTDLPFRRVLRPLLVAPLITPCYIIAICYVNFFGINGLGERLLASCGFPIHLPSIYGFWGAAGILILGAYPYVYTIVGASLNKLDPRFSEAARCLGSGRIKRFCSITLPLLTPALTAGTVLAALYVLSDFGVVSLLRYRTFVNTIYEQMSGRYSYSTAAALSTVLMGFTLMLFVLQGTLTQQKQYISSKNRVHDLLLFKLGWLQGPVFLFVCSVIMVGLVIPVGILIYWCGQSFTDAQKVSVWGTSARELIHSGINSVSISAMVATAAILLALPLGYWCVRKPQSLLARFLGWLSQSGIALPGVLTALGLSLVLGRLVPKLNFSVTALFLAFLVHFFAQGFQTTCAGLAQVSERLEEGARVLGCSAWKTFWRVVRPLLNPALFTAWILVFLSSMRELPASLLLRPAGFDPLTVRIWIAASEGFYEQAAAPALLVVFLSLPLVVILIKNKYAYQTSEILE